MVRSMRLAVSAVGLAAARLSHVVQESAPGAPQVPLGAPPVAIAIATVSLVGHGERHHLY